MLMCSKQTFRKLQFFWQMTAVYHKKLAKSHQGLSRYLSVARDDWKKLHPLF